MNLESLSCLEVQKLTYGVTFFLTFYVVVYSCKTQGFRSFFYFGPHIWNNLPQDVRYSDSLPSFKNKLKTFLFSEHFN